MIKRTFPCLVLAAVLAIAASSAEAVAWQHPVIQGYGGIVPLPHAAVQPDKKLQYKILFDVTKAARSPKQVDPALDHIARLINVFGSAGIKPSQMKLVAIVHGPATTVVLDRAAYRKKFGVDNPNLELVARLRKAGVKLFVCGQALAETGIAHKDVAKDFQVALSALTVLPTYQLEGYALMPF